MLCSVIVVDFVVVVVVVAVAVVVVVVVVVGVVVVVVVIVAFRYFCGRGGSFHLPFRRPLEQRMQVCGLIITIRRPIRTAIR